ncbi:MAG: LacI family DNA-binding transcriptional regulator [Treponema sp.]|jgi:DNA-binding LacI/PurR family transcriptional regulator|nr:LacI family DNA-binding transcriptional regulator [Treponema sp.]
MRTTIKDIASRLGISANSVSKALRGKSKIGEKTRGLILETAAAMNYIPNQTARALVRKELRIAAVYPEGPKEFFAYCTEGIRRAATELRDSKCRIVEYPYPSLETPGELRDTLAGLKRDKPDALVLTCSYQFDLYRADLEALGRMGIPIIYNTITGDETVPSFTGLVRINNYVSGQMAAEYLGMLLKPKTGLKKIALFVGNKNMLVHEECVSGFISNARKYGLELVDIFETHEDRKIVYKQTSSLLRLNPDLSGIYVTSYNSLGVCDWFDQHPRYRNVIILGQDLYPRLNKKLRAHTLTATLFQNQFELSRKSVQFAFEYLTGMRKKEECYKKYLPQLVLGCMVDNFPYYDRLDNGP